MNPYIASFINSVEERLPKDDLISSKDLIKAGIAKSSSTLYLWRNQGRGPAFIKISKKQIRYPRLAVLEWLRQRLTGGEPCQS